MQIKKTSKILSILLILAMMLTMLPMTVSAAGITGTLVINDVNRGNLSDSLSGTNWAWDPATATLTLADGYNEGKINFDDTIAGETVNLAYNGDVTVVNLNETSNGNTITNDNAQLVISGTGTLTINSNRCGILSKGDITINNGTIIINAAYEGIICDFDNVTINGGTVNIISEDYNAIYAWSDIIINGGSNHSFIANDYNGLYAENIKINGGTGIIKATKTDYAAVLAEIDIIVAAGIKVMGNDGSGSYSVASAIAEVDTIWGPISSFVNAADTTEPLKDIKFSADFTAPVLSAGSVNRTSDTAATIGFTTDEAGTAYYLVLASGAAAPTGAAVKAGTSLGAVTAGAVTGKAVNLTIGAKDIYVVVEDAAGNISSPLKIEAAEYNYKITASVGIGGTISPNGDVVVKKGEDQKFTIKPKDGYEIKSVFIDDKNIGIVDTYTFEKVDADHIIEAYFREVETSVAPPSTVNPPSSIYPGTGGGITGESGNANNTDKTENTGNKKLIGNVKIGKITPPSAAGYENIYKDVKAGDWFEDAVRIMTQLKLMSGSDTAETFKPNQLMSRYMLAAALYRLEGNNKVNEKMPFGDVKEGQWYSDAVVWAFKTGLMNGFPGDIFKGSDPLSREQIVTVFFRYAKEIGLDVSAKADLSEFADADKISDWALEAMQWAVAVGLIKGRTETTLVSEGNATRAEVATIIMRFMYEIYSDKNEEAEKTEESSETAEAAGTEAAGDNAGEESGDK